MEEEKKNKVNKEVIIAVLLVLAMAVIGFAMFFKRGDDKVKEEPKKTYVPNDVKLDGLALSFLKLETNKENLVYSPLSIKYALNMLRDGANGTTKEEIDKVIGDDTPTKYENIDKVLSLANSVFIRDTYKDYVKDEYISGLKDKYNAEFFYDEFKDASNVNNWIEEKTFNIIKDMLKDSDVQNPNLEMILVNALAIDMEWMNRFDAENTRGREFTLENGEKVNAAMMHQSTELKDYKYYKEEDFSAVTIPLKDYDGTGLELVVIMPNKEDLHSVVTSDNFDETVKNVLGNLHTVDNQELSITLPRFEFDYSLNLVDDLKTLGIKAAFDDNKADFSNMSERELVVGDARHKANIKVSEKGIKAGAATIIMMFDKAMAVEKEQVYLTFDKPFMFMIRDKETEEVWFTGNVYEPLLWDEVKDDYDYR